MRLHRRVAVAAVVLAVTASPATAGDGPSGGPTGGVNTFYGAFQTDVPIEVPPFREIGPKLTLSYSSSASNGIVGVGWQLGGLSYIERASPGRGAPKYDATDIFVLDGQELVASTGLGGTHATKIQSYQRITRDTGANKWYVWTKDGTKATYSAELASPSGTFRWALTAVADTSGNTVTYNHWCDGQLDCYPDTITYNGATVRFYRELRPDEISFATGASLARTRYRIKTVDVTIAGSRLRSYKLDYGSGGTAAVSVTVPASAGFATEANWGAYDPIHAWAAWFVADVTGDGKADVVYLDDAYTTNGWRVMRSTGTGLAAPVNWAAYDGVNDWSRVFLKDMNGDGKADILYLDDAYTTNGWRVMLSTGTSFNAPVNWGAYDPLNNWAAFWVADVTGDGKPDLVYLDDAYTTNGYRVMRNTGTSFAAPVNWGAYDTVNSWSSTWLTDVTGDGKADLLYLDDAYTTNGYRVMVSTGSSFAAGVKWASYESVNSWSSTWPADLNGDGKMDLLYLDYSYDARGYRALISTGTTFAAPKFWGPYDSVNSWSQVWVTDANGDGRDDLLYLDNQYGTNGYRLLASTGTGFAQPDNWGSYDALHTWSSFRIADFTGDGKVDLIYLDDAYTTNGYRVKVNTSSSATYYTSSATGRSLMTSVQTYGRDAVLDGTGSITSGTSLPPITATTPAPSAAFATEANWGAYDAINNWQAWWVADVTGDGKADLLYLDDAYTTNGYRVMRSTGTGFAAPVNWGAYDSVHGWAQTWVRDMNGDGKADLLYLDDAYTTNGYRVMLSTGTSFSAPQNWGAYDAINNWSGHWVTDVTGDGLPDLVYLDDAYTTNGYRVMRNTGTGFAAPVNWGAYDTVNSWSSTWMADMNGDGKDDLLYLDDAYTTNGYRVMLSTGTSFAAPVNWGAYDTVNSWSYTWPADVNGDGKMDLLYLDDAYDANGWRVLISTGKAFAAPVGWGAYDSVNGPTQTWVVDVNGDGRDDLVYLDNAYTVNGYRAMISGASGFAPPTNWGTYDTVHDWQAFAIADVTGDGLGDLVYLDDAYGTNGYRVKRNTSTLDILTSITSGAGATTTVAYTPSSAWANTNGPPIVQTVTSVAIADGRGGTSTRTYSYSGGLFDRIERRFLGFRYAKEVAPCLTGESPCPYSEAWFAQDYGSVSKVQETRLRDGAGNLLSYAQHVYTTNGATIPYTSLETGTWEYVYQGAAYRRSYVARSYDGYGNVTQEVTYGNYDLAGDERTARYQFVPNTTAYVVGKPAAIDTFAGTSTAGALLSQALLYYDGNTSWNAAPSLGRVTQSARWLDATGGYVTTKAGYDAWGNVVWEENELGQRTSFTIDATYHKFVTATTNPLGQSTTATWDVVCGVRTSSTDVNGGVTTRTHDALCRNTREDYPGGGWQTLAYLSTGSPTSQRIQTQGPSADGTSTTESERYFDGLGRTWQTTLRTGASSWAYDKKEYDARGNVKQTATYQTGETVYWTTYSYDTQDRVTRVTHPDGAMVNRSYALGEVSTVDEVGSTVTELLDASGRVEERREGPVATPTITSFDYDLRGNLSSVVDGAGNTTTFAYDSLGRRTRITDPDAGTTTFTYDAAGRLTQQVDAKAQTLVFSYDALGRRTQKVSKRSNGTVEQTVTMTYDQPRTGYKNLGRLTTMTDGAGTATYDHDAAGNLVKGTRTVDGVAYVFTKGYDAGGRLLWTTFPDADTVGTAASPLRYDRAGRLTQIPGLVTSVAYNGAGAITQHVNANGTVTNRTYNAQRRWMTALSTTKGASTLQSLSYGRDAEGKITSITSAFTGGSWTYGYDALDRLTSATNTGASANNQTFAYNAIGNMTSNSRVGTYTYGATGAARPHAVVQAGANTYTYDASGNMLSGAGRTLTWSVDHLPLTVNGTSFVYDGNGARLKKTTGGTSVVTLGDDYEIAGGVVTKYVSLGGAPVAKRVAGVPYWLHTDHLGSVQVVTDGAGLEVQRLEHRPYGERLSTATGHAESRGYTGQRQDETGLVYLHARYYDPLLGRFVSADPTVPTEAAVGLNRYAYAANNPINHTDIDGLGLFSGLKKLFKKIGNFFKKIGRALLSIAAKIARIPVIGGILALPFQAAGCLMTGDLAGFARAYATICIIVIAAVLTVMTGGIASPLLYIAANAAIGFGSGFLIAKVNGASTADALKAGLQGAAISAGVATLNVFARAMRADVQADQTAAGNPDGNVPSREFPGETNLAGGHADANSPLGGAQSNPTGRVFGIEYSKTGGGFTDRTLNFVTEHYSGPHDFLNKTAGAYGVNGTGLAPSTTFIEVMNAVNVPIATPLAMASMLQSTGGTAFIIGDRAMSASARAESRGGGTGAFANATGSSH